MSDATTKETTTMAKRNERARTGAATAVAMGAALLVVGGVGCLQILGDDGTFVRGTGGAGGAGGSGGESGGAGGSGGTGNTGGAGGTTSSTGVCEPGEVRSCYTGPDGTEGVGECKAGTETCAGDGSGWGDCEGQVLPASEAPTKLGDEACDGYVPGEAVWSKIYGDSDQQLGTVVATSPLDGSVYLSGLFEGTIDFGAGAVLDNQTTYTQAFLAKLDVDGAPAWAQSVVLSDTFNSQLLSVQGAADGGVFVVGYAQIAANIGGAAIQPGLFVVKLDPAGASQWARDCGGSALPLAAPAVVEAPNGNLVFAGRFEDSIDCGAGGATTEGLTDGFVVMLNGSTGEHVWTKTFGNSSNQFATGVGVDSGNNVLFAGQFEGSAGLASASISDASGKGAFVAKLSSGGDLLWSRVLGGAGDQGGGTLSIDEAGSAVVIGQFDSVLDLPGGGALMGASASNHYAIKLNASGVVEWSHVFESPGAFLLGNRRAPGGDVLISGAFDTSLGIGDTTLVASAPIECFIAKLQGADGLLAWHRTFGGTLSPIVFDAVDPLGFVVVTGSGFGALDFGNGALVTASEDVFLAKLKY